MVASKEVRDATDAVPDSLSQLTSQLPSPPPRPPSVTPSTRSSSKRSSLASTSAKQAKHLSAEEAEFVVTPNSAPLKPSILNVYAGYFPSFNSSGGVTGPSLREELVNSRDQPSEMPNGSPNFIPDEQPPLSPRAEQTPVRRPRRSSASTAKSKSRRTSMQRDREREGPSIVIRARSPESDASSMLGQGSISRESSFYGVAPSSLLRRETSSFGSLAQSVHSAADIPNGGNRDDQDHTNFNSPMVRKESNTTEQYPPITRLPRRGFREHFLGFFQDLFRTWMVLLYGILWPLGRALVSTIIPMGRRAHLTAAADESIVVAVDPRMPNETDDEDKTFAERFKYLVCTSFLLTTSLSISSYVSENVESIVKEQSESKTTKHDEIPLSTFKPRQVSNAVAADDSVEPSHSNLVSSPRSPLPHLDKRGAMLVNATLLAMILVALRIRSLDAWCRIAVFMLSLTWATIIGFDMYADIAIVSFDLSHTTEGVSHLRLFDEQHKRLAQGQYLPKMARERLKERSCRSVSKLIQGAQSFDIECNKAIAAVQEVELVARGFKLTHPLPPISRIEASNTSAFQSPIRNRQLPWASPMQSTPLSNARLSRSSSNGASAASAWKYGPRPLSHGVGSALSGRESPSGLPQQSQEPATSPDEPKRLASLRKALVNSFEEANYALKITVQELEGLADEKELALLLDMYEIATSSEVEAATIDATTSSARAEPWSAPGADSFQSWANTMPTRHSKRMSILPDGSPSSRILSFDDTMTSTPLKRLSLRSDGDRCDSRLSIETPSRRIESSLSDSVDSISSPLNQTAVTTPGRSSRLSYISEKRNSQSSIIGSGSIISSGTNNTSANPNDNGALKRLSYASASSAGVGSFRPPSISRPPPLQFSRASSPIGSGGVRGGQSPSARLTFDHRRRQSFAGLPSEPYPVDPYRLMSLKASFEATHLLRKKALCCLLALDYSLKRKINAGDAGEISSIRYWSVVDQSMQKLSERLEALAQEMRKLVRTEMNGAGSDDEAEDVKKKQTTTVATSDKASLKAPAEGVAELAAFDDRAEDMTSALRSIQVKLRACKEELRLRAPSMSLHGTKDHVASSTASSTGNSTLVENGSSTSREHASRIFQAIKEDLHSLSAYWEAAAKLLREPEASSSASPSLSDSTRLFSPQEAEEDALRRRRKDTSHTGRRSPSTSSEDMEELVSNSPGPVRGMPTSYLELALSQGRSSGEQSDISSLLIQEAMPEHLPPPGMEKVYESMANDSFASMRNRSKLSREERIKLAKAQRAREASEETIREGNVSKDPTGMIEELQRVMESRNINIQKQQQQQQQYQQRSPRSSNERRSVEAHQLGSPLDLGIVDEHGRFQRPMNGSRSPQSPPQSPSAINKRRNRESTGLDGQILDRVDEAFAF